ncbi:MAG: cupredoxin domain-containing protein [Candidatus Aquicultorales bacterium]
MAKGKNIQEVTMVIENVRFVPGSINLKKGVPVRLTIDRRENNVCSDELVIPQIGVRKVLTPFGKTVVEFTPEQEGALNLTCQMGMMQATAFVGAGAGGTQVARQGANPFFTFLMGGALAWVIITLKNTPGFINLPKPQTAPVPAAAVPSRPTAISRGRKGGLQVEVSYEMLMVAAVIVFAIFAGLYLGSPTNAGGPSSVSTPVQQAPPASNPGGLGPNGGTQVKEGPPVSDLTNASLEQDHYKNGNDVKSPNRLDPDPARVG